MEFQEYKSENTVPTTNYESDSQRVDNHAIPESDLFDETAWTQQEGDLPLWRMWR